MAKVTLGSGDSNRPKLPTLLQYVKAGNTTPAIAHVSIVFFPGKVPNYTLVCADSFRVSIQKGSDLFEVVKTSLDGWAESSLALAVRPDYDDPGTYHLEADEARMCDWIPEDWGWRLQEERKRPATTKSTRRGSGEVSTA